ncbi:MAG: glutamine amidotransferase [Planctomycetota bacterium]
MNLPILVCGHTVPPLVPVRGDFPDWFRAGLGLDAARAPAIDLPGGDPLPAPRDCGGVVVTGSPAMVTAGEPWSVAAEGWLAEAHAAGVPILGVCYGHQLLARALGGAVDWNPRGREIGTIEVELTPAADDDPLLQGLERPLVAQASHSQSVSELPPGAVLLGSNTIDPHQAFRLGATTWGVQFHPEFDAEIIRGYIEHRAESLREEGLEPAALSAATRDRAAGATLLRRFRHAASQASAGSD